jgi:hypothetical protein
MRRKQAVLFCKKEPKNFHPFEPGARHRRAQTDKSLFASFSSEKEDSSS